ncbi:MULTISPECIES: hypothetical protein [unclassified Bradyrhizobium]|uniref:hypothetical protein n=1 Tax=unclassified Bradyrhizobium TaxID=2631580 RepID=UPI002916B5D5|nr:MULTISPECIES: hypothetical protein [unclassified Bradyrhizobium]
MSNSEVRFEDNRHIGVIVPKPLVDAIDQHARKELISRSTWVRRTILHALSAQEQAATSKVPA